MEAQDQGYHFMERVLHLLGQLQERCIEPEQLADWGAAQPALLSGNADVQSAVEMIRFMDEMPGGFLIYRADREEKIIYANQALRRIFRCGTMEQFRRITGNSFRGIVHPEDLEEVEESIRRQIADSQYDLDYVEYRIICSDGAVRWIEDYGHFVHTQSMGDIFYVFLGDATSKRDRQISERALLLQEREDRIQALIQTHNEERASINQEYFRRLEVIEGLSINYESILYGDLDKNEIMFYRLNERIVATAGERFQVYSYTRCMADYILQWVCPEDRELVKRAVAPDYIRRQLAEHPTYYVNYRVAGPERDQYLQLRIVNVGSGDHISQIVMGCRRVDEELQREMEQKQLLADALTNANLAISAKNSFLSNMSHDMRTPLNAIFGFTALARQNIEDAQAVLDNLSRVEASGRQLLELIEKVLELSRIESGEAGLEQLPCNLRELAEEIYNFLQPQAEEKGIGFSLDCTGLVHGDVVSDPEKIKQLLLYLTNNAVTYTPHGGKVTITIEEEQQEQNRAVYRFVVADNGIGISQEFLDRVFDPFVREKNTTLSGIHGIGLGLTIAKSIADMLEGEIDVQSTEGKGSTFTIRLCLRLGQEGISDAPGQARNIGEAGSRRLLLVEDNEINLEIETQMLEYAGFPVETAENGQEAVEKMQNAPPGYYALVLMDIQMPVMDGWQATRCIRAMDDPLRANVPIIALSANVFDSDIRKSMESGMNAHLAKPIDMPVLERTIYQFISAGPQA